MGPDISEADEIWSPEMREEFAKMSKEKTFYLDEIWEAVYKATEGQAITYDRHDLADDVCDLLDGKKIGEKI